MFTDIVDSTGMTARLGDIRSVEMVRTHDSMVRRALSDAGGHEIKHTGDGIMASFDEVVAAVTSTRAIQRSFESFNRQELPSQAGVAMSPIPPKLVIEARNRDDWHPQMPVEEPSTVSEAAIGETLRRSLSRQQNPGRL